MNGPTYRVYRYRGDASPYDLQSLLASQVWCSNIESLNDPCEFQALLRLDAFPDLQGRLRAAGVVCFCRALTNPLLWSHYANAHRGFAIGYDPTHAFFGGDQGIKMRFLHDVRYEDVPPSLGFLTPEELVMAAVLTKPTCWAYEQEVRMIKGAGNQLADVPRDAVKEIVFGARMSEERIKEIVVSAKSKGLSVRFARMRLVDDGYGVKPEWMP